METWGRAGLRENKTGNAWIMGTLILIGILVVIVGIAAAFAGTMNWAYPAGYILLGLTFISGGIAIGPGKIYAGWATLILGIIAVVVLLGASAALW